MWQREVIGQQTYLNTQDAVYEVLSKTPEEILCKSADAVKIDMMLKQSQNADLHPTYNVRYVPYKNIGNGMIINPNAGGNFSEKIALAIAFIAADRDDWQRFIPVGMKAREIAKTKKRQQEIVAKQNMPFKDRPKRGDDDEEDEEFMSVDRDEELESSDGDDDIDDKPLLVYDHKKGEYITETDDDEPQQKVAEKKLTLPQEEAATKQLNDRVAQVLKEQEERSIAEGQMLPSDRKRRQVATLNDPACEANAAVIAQHYHGADAEFDVEEEREKARERECGVKSDPKNASVGLLDRFAPKTTDEKTISMEPIAHEKGKAPQYSIQQLMEFGSRTKPSPSVQRLLDQKNGVVPPATVAVTPPPMPMAKPDFAAKVSSKCIAIRRKQLELATLMIELEELLQ